MTERRSPGDLVRPAIRVLCRLTGEPPLDELPQDLASLRRLALQQRAPRREVRLDIIEKPLGGRPGQPSELLVGIQGGAELGSSFLSLADHGHQARHVTAEGDGGLRACQNLGRRRRVAERRGAD